MVCNPATYGNYLQVFPLETGTLPSPAQEYLLLEFSFDFSRLVFTDTSAEVVVSTVLSGYSTGFIHIGSTTYINKIAVFPGNEAYSTFVSVASALQGPNSLFYNGKVTILLMPSVATSIQFTLSVSRLPTHSEKYTYKSGISFE
jgi:hypothetical protein